MKQKQKTCCERLGRVGGQAVLEGVMMKAGERTVTSCRKSDGSIVVTDGKFTSVRKKHKLLNLPILRGVVNFIEMMKLSVHTLEVSANALGLEEEEETKFEKWLKKHFGMNITKFVMIIGVILGAALAIGLFMLLPALISDGIDWLVGGRLGAFTAVVEGVAKIGIFLLYLWLVSFMSDIRRTFMYHGAEHKSIACFEAGEELTPENAMKHTRFHPRCGTSFMFFMILLGVIVGLFVRILWPDLRTWAYVLIRLLILPLVVGIGYEFIMFAGKHDNLFVRLLSAPGLWVQRITTKEPTLDMLEVAIVSIKCALRDDFAEFAEFYEARGWEPTVEEVPVSEAESIDVQDVPEAICAEDGATDAATAEDTCAEAPREETAEQAPETASESNEAI